jgi:hypothetical protein
VGCISTLGDHSPTLRVDAKITEVRMVIYIVLIRSVFGVLLIMRELRQFWF